jgi:hypothetical protein
MNAARMLVAVLTFSCLQTAAALADDTAPPNATATRPAKQTTGQSSTPSSAPAATVTQPTGANTQDPTTKRMNEVEKKKVETEGK